MIREEEFYFDLESGNDDQVDIVSPARGSLQSSQQPHGGSIEIFFTPGCKYVTNHYSGLQQEGACDLVVLIRGLYNSELKLYELSAK